MAKYKIVEMNDLRGDGQVITYPKLIHMGQIKSKELAQLVAERSTMSIADVQGTLVALSQVMAQQMALGYSVELEDIGIFSAKLGMIEGVEREEVGGEKKKNASSIRVANINFKANKSLINTTQERIRLERVSNFQREEIRSTKEERFTLAESYIQSYGAIRPKIYAQMTGLERTKAGAELREFAKDGLLKARGLATHIYYTLE